MTDCMSCKYRKGTFIPCNWLKEQKVIVIPPCPRYERDENSELEKFF